MAIASANLSHRGNGFFHAGSGRITARYAVALDAHGLQSFFGDDASIQPGKLQEIMLHETAVEWVYDLVICGLCVI